MRGLWLLFPGACAFHAARCAAPRVRLASADDSASVSADSDVDEDRVEELRAMVRQMFPSSTEQAAEALDVASLPEDANILVTELNRAIKREDYVVCQQLKLRLDKLRSSEVATKDLPTSWESLGAAPWLQFRLNDLGLRVPTPVQALALDALARTPEAGQADPDVVIRAPTGSGKTLAFLLPIASRLTRELEERESTCKEAISNMGMLTPSAAMVALSPAMYSSARLAAPSRPAKLHPDRGAPLCLLLAPSQALALQTASALYSLVGGNARELGAYFPGDRASIFSYKGPKGLRISALASDADGLRAVEAARARGTEARFGADLIYDDLVDCDVLVADAATLDLALTEAPDLFDPAQIRFLAVDEADACGEAAERIVAKLGGLPNAVRALVGASVDLGSLGASPLLRTAGEALVVEPGHMPRMLSADERNTWDLPRGLVHRVVAVDEWRRLGVLARMMRKDLDEWAASPQTTPRPRVVVFARTEEAAKEVAPRLRDALWGVHAINALLPTIGEAPMRSAVSFSQTNTSGTTGFVEAATTGRATVLVTATRAARGLDFPNVTHVYCLGAPVPSEQEPNVLASYAHQAGRAGRVGQRSRGVVTTITDAEDAANLQTLFAENFLGVELLVQEEEELPFITLGGPEQAQDTPDDDDDDDDDDGVKSEEAPQTDAYLAARRAYLEDLVSLYDAAPNTDNDAM